MRNKVSSRSLPVAWNASLLALIVFLAAMLYIFGTAFSGETPSLTRSVQGANIIDSRDVRD
ncbi:hypothetical protein [Oryzifoliimicrobium ureilyticus]|uniref:hypothetical protein n=1 Tax=Oryzifoliimicrobium ureilyticus TaxID=3113724 RepID=UPI0030761679